MDYNRRKYRITLIFIPILIFLSYILYKNIGAYTEVFQRQHLIRNWIVSFGRWSFAAFIILQVMQVVLMFVPGEVIQATGGYAFGTFWGTVLAFAGIFIGSIITFSIGRTFGEPLLRKILPGKKLTTIMTLVNKPGNKIVLIILYSIPGVPKDILGYVSGITPIKFKQFVIISTVTRIPGILASTYFGSNLYHRNYLILSVSAVIILVLVIVGISKKDKILSYIK